MITNFLSFVLKKTGLKIPDHTPVSDLIEIEEAISLLGDVDEDELSKEQMGKICSDVLVIVQRNTVATLQGKATNYQVVFNGGKGGFVVLPSLKEATQVVEYLNGDERHGLLPGNVLETDRKVTHGSFTKWLIE